MFPQNTCRKNFSGVYPFDHRLMDSRIPLCHCILVLLHWHRHAFYDSHAPGRISYSQGQWVILQGNMHKIHDIQRLLFHKCSPGIYFADLCFLPVEHRYHPVYPCNFFPDFSDNVSVSPSVRILRPSYAAGFKGGMYNQGLCREKELFSYILQRRFFILCRPCGLKTHTENFVFNESSMDFFGAGHLHSNSYPEYLAYPPVYQKTYHTPIKPMGIL